VKREIALKQRLPVRQAIRQLDRPARLQLLRIHIQFWLRPGGMRRTSHHPRRDERRGHQGFVHHR
jgi:hypothetical protein